MKACEQASGLTIYQHGLAVANRYRDLHKLLSTGSSAYAWHIEPDDMLILAKLLPAALSPKEARMYHIFHDCGKPSCLQVDADGKRRFPGHAEASAALFRKALPGDELSARLIEKDMLCHTTKPAQAQELLADPDFSTLLLTAWSELHANAEALFGGFQADSFKIKRKQLSKLGQKFFRHPL